MKKILLILLCALTVFSVQLYAQPQVAGKSTDTPIPLWFDDGCIGPDGRLYAMVSPTMHNANGGVIYLWVLAPDDMFPPWIHWHGPVLPVSITFDGTNWIYVYDFSGLVTLNPNRCYEFFYWIRDDVDPKNFTGYKKVFCPCPVPPCNANFCYEVCTGSPNIVTFMPQVTHQFSTYHWDYGNGHTSSYPQSVIYAPGNYTICMTEHQSDGTECTKCVDLCVNEGSTGGHHLPDGHRSSAPVNDPKKYGIKNMMELYPNPASSMFTVGLVTDQNSEVKIRIVDISGQVVSSLDKKSVTAGSNKIEVTTEGFAPGTYTVEVINGAQVSRQKLVIK